MIHQHVAVGLIGYREKMRWHLGLSLAHEHSRHRVGVDRQALVGVDDDAEQTGISLENDRMILTRFG